jgi:hypothetical protein
MLLESTLSRLYNASCFEDIDHTEHSIDGENMKQPLISMGNESLEDEEQIKLSQESASRSASSSVKAFFLEVPSDLHCFLVGAFVGFISLWMIVDWHLGRAIAWMPIFSVVFIAWVLLFLAFKCFDLVRASL